MVVVVYQPKMVGNSRGIFGRGRQFARVGMEQAVDSPKMGIDCRRRDLKDG